MNKMVHLARTPEDEAKSPYGSLIGSASLRDNDQYRVRIPLDGPELEKLDLDTKDVEKGDALHFRAIGIVDSYGDGPMGKHVCLCITHIEIEGEDEDKEHESEDEPDERSSKRYGSDEADEA